MQIRMSWCPNSKHSNGQGLLGHLWLFSMIVLSWKFPVFLIRTGSGAVFLPWDTGRVQEEYAQRVRQATPASGTSGVTAAFVDPLSMHLGHGGNL